MSNGNQISRREFIKNAAIATAAAATAGVMSSTSVQAQTQCPPTVPAKWDQVADIVVVGTGLAGYCAAIDATDLGSSVIVLEKMPHIGGNAIQSGGHMEASGTHVQKNLGIEDRPDWHYEDILRHGGYRAKPELVRTFVDNSADLVLWLEKLGVKWPGTLSHYPDYQKAARGHTAVGQGYALISTLDAAAKQRRIPILLEHKVTRIIREGLLQGRVLGVEVESKSGKLFIGARKAVILASGGWKGDKKLRKVWDPRLTEELLASGEPYAESTGEAILSAVDVGAGLTDMGYVFSGRLYVGFGHRQMWFHEPPKTPFGTYGVSINQAEVILVNKGGKRFHKGTPTTWDVEWVPDLFWDAVLQQEGKIVWAIADAETAKRREWKIEEFIPPRVLEGYFFSAPSIEELATKIGVSADGLKQTVQKWNSYVDTGKDPEFGANPKNKIGTPPFYGVRMSLVSHNVVGGLTVNSKSQVLDRNGSLIPGLYAAGECCGGYFGKVRAHGKLGVYGVFGRIAAKNAAAEKPWDVKA